MITVPFMESSTTANKQTFNQDESNLKKKKHLKKKFQNELFERRKRPNIFSSETFRHPNSVKSC